MFRSVVSRSDVLAMFALMFRSCIGRCGDEGTHRESQEDCEKL